MRLLVVGILFVAAVAFAEGHGENIDQAKQEHLKMLDARIANLTQAKTCVSAATTHEALKECHMQLEKSMRAAMGEMKEHRRQHLDDQIKKLQDEKAKMDQKE